MQPVMGDLVGVDAIKAASFRFQLFIYFIHILTHKARSESSAWVETYTRVRITVMYLYHGGSHASGNLALMGISICIQM